MTYSNLTEVSIKFAAHLEVSGAEAVERTVMTAELLPCVLPQVNIQVGFEKYVRK